MEYVKGYDFNIGDYYLITSMQKVKLISISSSHGREPQAIIEYCTGDWDRILLSDLTPITYTDGCYTLDEWMYHNGRINKSINNK